MSDSYTALREQGVRLCKRAEALALEYQKNPELMAGFRPTSMVLAVDLGGARMARPHHPLYRYLEAAAARVFDGSGWEYRIVESLGAPPAIFLAQYRDG